MIWFCCDSCVRGSSRLRLSGKRRASRRIAVLRSWRTSQGVVMTSTSARLRPKSARAAARLYLGNFLVFLVRLKRSSSKISSGTPFCKSAIPLSWVLATTPRTFTASTPQHPARRSPKQPRRGQRNNQCTLHAQPWFYRFSSRFVEIVGARVRALKPASSGFCPTNCGNTSSVVLSVTMLVFFSRTAGARRVACDFAPGRRVVGVEVAPALAGLQRRASFIANSRLHLGGQCRVG